MCARTRTRIVSSDDPSDDLEKLDESFPTCWKNPNCTQLPDTTSSFNISIFVPIDPARPTASETLTIISRADLKHKNIVIVHCDIGSVLGKTTARATTHDARLLRSVRAPRHVYQRMIQSDAAPEKRAVI
eukprot:6193275-Pleurochrysis_carterae.AAC.2